MRVQQHSAKATCNIQLAVWTYDTSLNIIIYKLCIIEVSKINNKHMCLYVALCECVCVCVELLIVKHLSALASTNIPLTKFIHMAMEGLFYLSNLMTS